VASSWKFVDSVAASPTTRLDISAGVWSVMREGTELPAPPLRRAVSGTLLADGELIPAAAYGNRTLHLRLLLAAATQADAATQLGNLGRELDRASNFLRFDPDGSHAVFFRTFRAPEYRSEWVDSAGQFFVQVDIPAEPFAYGLREDVGAVTVTNDPAAGSNGMFFDVSSVKGDVATPLLVKCTSGLPELGILAARQHDTPSDLVFFMQAEGGTPLTDTTNPGGGPDALMSGAGTNNYLRTSFATVTTLAQRVQLALGASTDAQKRAIRGTYRVFAVVRRSDTTSVMTMQWVYGSQSMSSVVTIPKELYRQLVDMGTLTIGGSSPASPGRFSAQAPTALDQLFFWAGRASGTGTLDWDVVLLIPADDQMLISSAVNASGGTDGLIDSENDQIYLFEDAADPFAGTADLGTGYYAVAGGFPKAVPGQTNRYFLVTASTVVSPNHVKATTWSVTAHYWPRYLYVRPT